MAVTNFKTRIFSTALDLQKFVLTDPNVATIVAIVTNNEGKFIIFYITA